MATLTHGSLFSGIGGFDLAAAWAGWKSAFVCEIDPFCRKVLKYHFPEAIQYEDIHTTNFSVWRGRIDVLTGGFPCQPFSLAGKRKGTKDDRYLWPEMFRAIREIRPRWVVAENVHGFVNWSDGLVFEQVCSALEDAGYEIQAYLLPACSVNAPHKRYRIWIIAYCSDTGIKEVQQQGQNRVLSAKIIANRHSELPTHRNEKESKRRNPSHGVKPHDKPRDWEKFPTQCPICGGNDGLPFPLDGITFSTWRRESVKGYGNAIVPQVALRIFQTINEMESGEGSTSGKTSIQ